MFPFNLKFYSVKYGTSLLAGWFAGNIFTYLMARIAR